MPCVDGELCLHSTGQNAAGPSRPRLQRKVDVAGVSTAINCGSMFEDDDKHRICSTFAKAGKRKATPPTS